jgi:hypothetical protein
MHHFGAAAQNHVPCGTSTTATAIKTRVGACMFLS